MLGILGLASINYLVLAAVAQTLNFSLNLVRPPTTSEILEAAAAEGGNWTATTTSATESSAAEMLLSDSDYTTFSSRDFN